MKIKTIWINGKQIRSTSNEFRAYPVFLGDEDIKWLNSLHGKRKHTIMCSCGKPAIKCEKASEAIEDLITQRIQEYITE